MLITQQNKSPGPLILHAYLTYPFHGQPSRPMGVFRLPVPCVPVGRPLPHSISIRWYSPVSRSFFVALCLTAANPFAFARLRTAFSTSESVVNNFPCSCHGPDVIYYIHVMNSEINNISRSLHPVFCCPTFGATRFAEFS